MEHIDLQGFTDQAIEHAQRPRNKGILPEFNAEGRITGPCGETMA
ncbi:MAG TPA: iron-sulfur cluster assembly scaffold protein, partial [Syntrophus sp. (in: bacteria)]|nr:iron-sulfur cluster assembly scaffold protein [Syntrophus sp. (in: bacteria)]